MTLAQVVYKMSTDADFAKQWREDPERTLAKQGLTLSKEEQAFLLKGLKRQDPENLGKLNLKNVGFWLPWVWL
jgi:hypothetical protein